MSEINSKEIGKMNVIECKDLNGVIDSVFEMMKEQAKEKGMVPVMVVLVEGDYDKEKGVRAMNVLAPGAISSIHTEMFVRQKSAIMSRLIMEYGLV